MLFFKRSKTRSPIADEVLLKDFQESKDNAVLGELYERYLSLIYGLCLKYLKNREEAKDMVMHIFENLSKKLPQQPNIQHFKSWVYTFARNECLMHLRKDKKMVYQYFFGESEEGSMENIASQHLVMEEDTIQEQSLQWLEKGLAELSTEQQACVQLFYLDKKSYQEIADTTGYDLNKVKSFIQNGKRNLKIFIEKNRQNNIGHFLICWLFYTAQ